MENRQVFKGILAGLAGGMAAAWAVNRFYTLARRSADAHSLLPYGIGAAVGATYVAVIENRGAPRFARVPLSAALWMGEPGKASSGAEKAGDMSQRAGNIAVRLATRGLKKAAERALFA